MRECCVIIKRIQAKNILVYWGLMPQQQSDSESYRCGEYAGDGDDGDDDET